MRASVYLHSSKDLNFEIGEELGLKGRTLRTFANTLPEVEMILEVDEQTRILEFRHASVSYRRD